MLGLPTLLLRQSLRRSFSTTSAAASSFSVTSSDSGLGTVTSSTSESETENLHDQVTTRKLSREECENLGPQQRSMFCDDKKIDPKNDFAVENDARWAFYLLPITTVPGQFHRLFY